MTLERVLTVSGSSSTFAPSSPTLSKENGAAEEATKAVAGLIGDLTLQSYRDHPSSSSTLENTSGVDKTEDSGSKNSISVVFSSAKTNDGSEEEEGDWIQEPSTVALFETLELNDSDLDHPRE